MRIVFTKLTDQRHRLELRREGYPCEAVELETRSLLLHDLTHFAVEARAEITEGVYGRLAAGSSLAELAQAVEAPGLAMAEDLVGPMQSLFNGRGSRERYLELGRARYPQVVDEAFVDDVLESLRRLVGRWRATPFGGSMELTWPARDAVWGPSPDP
ncbi:hypothetical protein [Engelhardtia mirabilis]|uniref:Uncharacterized protein n=1 Tax=Engelhardtia mirabilis TaxID=2528011 RepID=A0A518BM40_9BACT|nr:hypothetical protein Pla133_31400 [Planctomycetes bacterium Pla133]QDV02374.1 hypothetical protein Pla86_31390 [Planctomycetes bacterium Pla86]